jgi:DNA ligase-1
MTLLLKTTEEFIEQMNTTNSTNDKKEVLKKFPIMKELLEAIYNPFKQYNVTSANLKKNINLISDSTYGDIFMLLDALNKRLITGHDAIAHCNRFIKDHSAYEDILYKIIDKDLECRIGDKIINDVYKDLIPTFEVALANSFDDYASKVNFEKDTWYASHKLDGCRCICVIDKSGDIKFFSRQGNEFLVLDNLKKEIETYNLKSVVFDGEICIVDKNGKEDFQSVMKEIRKKDHTIKNLRYLVFDQISYTDFFNHSSNVKLSDRLENLKQTSKNIQNNKLFFILPQIKVEDVEHLQKMRTFAEKEGWEGLILRKDCGYKGKRSNDLLKCKKMLDGEYKVVDIEFGPFRIIDNVTRLEKTIETLSNVVIEHKGNRVSVGSGFTLDERMTYYNNPELIKGKIICVKYFEETLNQDGKYSLRFPIFKINYGDKRAI